MEGGCRGCGAGVDGMGMLGGLMGGEVGLLGIIRDWDCVLVLVYALCIRHLMEMLLLVYSLAPRRYSYTSFVPQSCIKHVAHPKLIIVPHPAASIRAQYPS